MSKQSKERGKSQQAKDNDWDSRTQKVQTDMMGGTPKNLDFILYFWIML